MFIAFIDESGKPTKKEKTPFVLAALIVKDRELNRVRREVSSIRTKYNLDPSIEFHARDIVHGKRGFFRIDMNTRKRILDDLINVIKNLDVTLIASVVRKRKILIDPIPDSEVRSRIESIGYELLVERLILFLEKQGIDEWMMLVIDETDFRHDISIRRSIENVVTQGFYASRWPASQRVFPQPIFAPSKNYDTLQLADIVAYTVFKIYSKPISAVFDFRDYFRLLERKFDRCRDGRIFGCGIKDYTF